MSHYHVDVPVDKEDVKIIKEELMPYIDSGHGFTVEILPIDETHEASPKLQHAIKMLCIKLIVAVSLGKFKGLN